jgi:hypothetical protein
MADLTNLIFTEDAARRHFEATRWPDGPYCPLCMRIPTMSPGYSEIMSLAVPT